MTRAGRPTSPSVDSEWAVLLPSCFVTRVYDVQPSALIFPDGVSVHDKKGLQIEDYWTGKIRDIRVRPNDQSVGSLFISCRELG